MIDVITVDDIPGHVDIGPVFEGDPLLTSDQIDFCGQAIFAVLAKSHKQAKRAVQKAQIEYKKLPPVLDLTMAVAQEYYVRPPHRMQRGDSPAALAKAKNRVNGSLRIGGCLLYTSPSPRD